MHVYIFGAGASKASQAKKVKDSKTSPLVNELVNDRYQVFAKHVAFPLNELRSYKKFTKLKPSLEALLTKRWNKISQLKTEPSKDAERTSFGRFTFYIWKLLLAVSETYDEDNLYRLFLNNLRRQDEKFGIINFNYDILLDHAYQDIYGYDFSKINNYIKFNYIKPHGSVNWFIGKRTQDSLIGGEYHRDTKVRLNKAANLIYGKLPLSLDKRIVIDPSHRDLKTVDAIIARADGQYFYPLIFIPVTLKMYDLISGFEQKVITAGKKLLSQASEITLIGYQAQDEIIIDMLKDIRKGVKLNVISLKDSFNIAKHLIKLAPNLKKGKISINGFEEYLIKKNRAKK